METQQLSPDEKFCSCCEENLESNTFHIYDPTEIVEPSAYSHAHCFIWQNDVEQASERINIFLVFIREAIEMMWEDGATKEDMEALLHSAMPHVEDLRKVVAESNQNIQRSKAPRCFMCDEEVTGRYVALQDHKKKTDALVETPLGVAHHGCLKWAAKIIPRKIAARKLAMAQGVQP